eukprot:Gb_40236 [translate_table: standard]
MNFNVLDYDEKVMDGFYDVYGILSDPSSQGKMPSLVDLQGTPVSDNMGYEVVLVDRVSDPALEQLEQRALCIALECGSAELGPLDSDLVQRIADLVAEHMGGPVSDADDMLTSWTVRSYKLRASLNNIVLPLGCLQIGLSRHRALLFKVLADRVGIPCRLVKGSHYTGTDDGAINIIKLDHESTEIPPWGAVPISDAPWICIPTLSQCRVHQRHIMIVPTHVTPPTTVLPYLHLMLVVGFFSLGGISSSIPAPTDISDVDMEEDFEMFEFIEEDMNFDVD